MSRATESYEKFNYAVRPSKQVERKLLIEALHYIGHNLDYSLKDYRYLGFGSVYFTDFILLHKYLYLRDMLCIEGSDVPRRMAFNKPYRFIKVKMGRLSDVLPGLKFKRPHIVWLDYDYGLDYGPFEQMTSILDDVRAVVGKLNAGSIFIVTAESEPKLSDREENDRLSEDERETRLVELLETTCGDILGTKIVRSMLTRREMPLLVARVLRNLILDATLRINPKGVRFFQLFNFVYADGAQMVTVGGIVDNASQMKPLRESGIYGLDFIKRNEVPIRISVPPLTIREKEAIDAQIDQRTTAKSLRLKSEIKKDLLKNYLKYYKHYPTYHEAVL
jgi:hypothetical protein